MDWGASNHLMVVRMITKKTDKRREKRITEGEQSRSYLRCSARCNLICICMIPFSLSHFPSYHPLLRSCGSESSHKYSKSSSWNLHQAIYLQSSLSSSHSLFLSLSFQVWLNFSLVITCSKLFKPRGWLHAWHLLSPRSSRWSNDPSVYSNNRSMYGGQKKETRD